MKRKAFTLVELLVVIGIIALLISILLPTLSRARASAQRTVCLSNQRQIAVATQSYSVDENGFIAPRFRFVSLPDMRATGAGSIPGNNPLWFAYFFGRDAGSSVNEAYNLGALAYTGHLGLGPIDLDVGFPRDPEFFFCPSNPPANGSAYSEGTGRAGYFYNPHWALFTTSFGELNTTRYHKLIQMDAEKALSLDIIPTFNNQGGEIAHKEDENRPSWNLAFRDGHAENVVSKDVAEAIKTRPASHLNRLDDLRDILETVAAGRDPKTGPANNPLNLGSRVPVVHVQ